MKGYKAFNRVEGSNNSGTCRAMLFEEGKEYQTKGTLKICSNGLHFCEHLVQTFEYYEFNHNVTIYAEVEALGVLDTEDALKFKYATDKMRVVRFLSPEEVDNMFADEQQNTGDWNTGNWNTGNWNTGNWNTGNQNTGNWNTGNWNTGNWNTGNLNIGNQNIGNQNTGNWNTGNQNTGDWNTGNLNIGNWNTGDWNTGNWNTSDKNTGFFNTEEIKEVLVFNKPCLLAVWEKCNKPNFIYFELKSDKTYKESFIESFNSANKYDMTLLVNLPNFDYTVFEEVSGITKEMIDTKLGK